MGHLKQANLRLHQILELVITLSLCTSMECYCRVYMILGDQQREVSLLSICEIR